MRTSIEVIPFPGFYETIFSELVIEENERYWLNDQYPDFKYLDDWEINIDIYRPAVAKEFAELYISELEDKLHLGLELDTQSIASPREYNFTNDKIICHIEVGDYDKFIHKVWKWMNEPEIRPQLAKLIKKYHTSCDGFWSWMSNEIEDWYAALLDSKNTHYLEWALWYLYCIVSGESADGSSDYGMSDLIYEQVVSNTDYASLMPTTDRAKEEYELWQKEEERKETMRSWPKIPGLEC